MSMSTDSRKMIKTSRKRLKKTISLYFAKEVNQIKIIGAVPNTH